MTGSVDPQEIAHFAKDSRDWWDENGPFRPLHRLNPVRLRYIRDRIIDANPGAVRRSLKPLDGLKILDIGCGGGLVCEPLARMGATVTGIDADEQAITVARAHADQSGLDITYKASSAEELHGEKFDVVLALEIVEHVADIDGFMRSVSALCKPGGIIIMSTLNRTAKSFLLGIVAAEYILRWVPRGTHQWGKFVKPSTLSRTLRAAGADVTHINGLIYNPVKDEFALSPTDIDVNYLITAEKK
ncbi:MAG: bifunctional 2-polyprenyl-6-hydroxyphenol methylase/3-demethylubiquinol 3-O-methyltransferase UbiG [Alphaproteobacteria bacterium]|nr:bifunctional 2-polyprenyl-6-hydroxyphenol methylase/3-demethylubiquinol 3-O-methyltransferase UbiG [Alphaproteobacteria bacterium]MBU0859075.1 bifunctional 2-polyprenyl-6-hydroxyphenol methylase/3-demethylubiquinol 3-O-methyltransferase UbiG [Alphaproteobacteria bacterium]